MAFPRCSGCFQCPQWGGAGTPGLRRGLKPGSLGQWLSLCVPVSSPVEKGTHWWVVSMNSQVSEAPTAAEAEGGGKERVTVIPAERQSSSGKDARSQLSVALRPLAGEQVQQKPGRGAARLHPASPEFLTAAASSGGDAGHRAWGRSVGAAAHLLLGGRGDCVVPKLPHRVTRHSGHRHVGRSQGHPPPPGARSLQGTRLLE